MKTNTLYSIYVKYILLYLAIVYPEWQDDIDAEKEPPKDGKHLNRKTAIKKEKKEKKRRQRVLKRLLGVKSWSKKLY